ncbi:MAG: hypothetical protein K6G80_07135 [Treponema sp.]|nr:hypothetical protein [Treponema sp.]
MRVSINGVLGFTAVALFIAIVAVSAVALCTRNAVPGEGLRKIDPVPEHVTAQNAGTAAFTRIGQLRTSTKPDSAERRTVIIVTPWLEYAASDAALYEELDTKQRSLRSAISAYFTRFTDADLKRRGETLVKADLLALVNSMLVLGKVQAIYFNEYQFFD